LGWEEKLCEGRELVGVWLCGYDDPTEACGFTSGVWTSEGFCGYTPQRGSAEIFLMGSWI